MGLNDKKITDNKIASDNTDIGNNKKNKLLEKTNIKNGNNSNQNIVINHYNMAMDMLKDKEKNDKDKIYELINIIRNQEDIIEKLSAKEKYVYPFDVTIKDQDDLIKLLKFEKELAKIKKVFFEKETDSYGNVYFRIFYSSNEQLSKILVVIEYFYTECDYHYEFF